MSRKKKEKIEFRYYRMPESTKMFSLLGDKWDMHYGRDIDYLHFHNFMEIGYCYRGPGIMTLGSKEYRFYGGEFTVIPRNFPHTTNSDPGYESKWEYLFIDTEGFFQNICLDIQKRTKILRQINSAALFIKEEEYPEMGMLVRKILNVMRGCQSFYYEEAAGLMIALLSKIARFNSAADNLEKTSEIKTDLTASDDRKSSSMMTSVVNYIGNHYSEPIKIKELAGFCHMSETQFRRIFTSYMNMGPLEYINRYRIRMACEYLGKTDDIISDIASKCGFTTSSTFNRNFFHLTGMTPQEWRKRPENMERNFLEFDVHTEKGW